MKTMREQLDELVQSWKQVAARGRTQSAGESRAEMRLVALELSRAYEAMALQLEYVLASHDPGGDEPPKEVQDLFGLPARAVQPRDPEHQKLLDRLAPTRLGVDRMLDRYELQDGVRKRFDPPMTVTSTNQWTFNQSTSGGTSAHMSANVAPTLSSTPSRKPVVDLALEISRSLGIRVHVLGRNERSMATDVQLDTQPPMTITVNDDACADRDRFKATMHELKARLSDLRVRANGREQAWRGYHADSAFYDEISDWGHDKFGAMTKAPAPKSADQMLRELMDKPKTPPNIVAKHQEQLTRKRNKRKLTDI